MRKCAHESVAQSEVEGALENQKFVGGGQIAELLK